MPVAPPEIKIVETRKIACDGGEGALGHPRVWLVIPDDTGWVECGYCDAKYVLKGREADAGIAQT
ncbi:MAG: zinc-finger domain-containing protein [Pseudooceanicola sp.]